MKIWAIGDLHLPSTRNKPMDKFGPHWENHMDKVRKAWIESVGSGDVVILPGDFSWAMRLHEIHGDFQWLASLPGRPKIFVRGNHDYWWETKTKMAKVAPPEAVFLHNQAISIPPFVLAGSRGWELPSPDCTEEENAERERLCVRERDRLQRSFEMAKRLAEESTARRETEAPASPGGTGSPGRGPAPPEPPSPWRLIAALHLPPIYADQEATLFTEVIDQFAPETVVYGHLHAEAIQMAFQGKRKHTRYVLTSADALDFKPVLIADSEKP